jgi:hypothetical protein
MRTTRELFDRLKHIRDYKSGNGFDLDDHEVGLIVGEIEKLRAALEPFAEVSNWAARNNHNLSDFDMILRGPDHKIAGHLHAQSKDFINAAKTVDGFKT